MLSDLWQAIVGLFVVVLGALSALLAARANGKAAQRAMQQTENLDAVKEARDVETGIDRSGDDDVAERLRKYER